MEVRKENVQNIYSLSPTQEGMLFHHLESQNSEAYLQQISYHVHGKLDPERFEAAWNELIRRHDILRTAFVHTNTKQPLQVVLKECPLDFTFHDVSELDALRQQAFLDSFREHDRRNPFDPSRARLMRITLIRLNQAEFEVVWSHHHIITDGWSIGILQSELVEIYQALDTGRLPDLPPAPPYSAYIRFLNALDGEASARFWREYLAGYSRTASIPSTADVPLGTQPRYGEFILQLEPVLEQRLTDFAREIGVTTNTVLQMLWAVLLGRYSGLNDVVFGSVVSGRPPEIANIERMAGIFVNTVPVRVRILAHSTFRDVLAKLQGDFAAREPHQYLSLARVQAESELKHNLLGVVTAMENYPVESQLQAVRTSNQLGFTVDRVRVTERTHYNFLVQFLPSTTLTVKFQYNEAIYSPASVERVGCQFITLLESAVHDPDITVRGLNLTIAESGPVQVPRIPVGKFRAIHRSVESQAANHPETIALSCDGKKLSYGELNELANRLAHTLRSAGVAPETRVGICCARSIELIVSMLAVLKAGGIYVPMDPAYPRDRLAYLVTDSAVSLVIADAEGARSFNTDVPIIAPDAVTSGDVQNIDQECFPDQAAYIIYTSGSTGNPKGCVVTQENVSRLFAVTESQFGFGPNDVWTMFHSAAFDFSVWEIWGALAYGGRLVIVPYWISRSPSDFWKVIETEQVTVLNQTPSAFRQLLAAQNSIDTDEMALRVVIFGGEALNLQSLIPWFESPLSNQARLVNMYGITETTVHVTYRPIEIGDVQAGRGSVIGDPITDLSLHLLDEHLTSVPIGTVGEIYVGGAGVSRGYWRRPALTAERFMPDPFGSPGSRLYRSGDLARRLPNGELEYMGRCDEQVKIRGFRIELSEIESVLSSHLLVREAVVIAAKDTDGHSRLIAYISGPGDGDLDQVRFFVRKKLPDYMTPGVIMLLDRLPLTAHGKVDRKMLPVPERLPRAAYVPPRTPVEETLAAVWAKVLGVERVGIHEKYLELGGDSISAIRVVSALLQHKLKIGVRDLFRHATIEELAPHVQAISKTAIMDAQLFRGPLSPIQSQFLDECRVDTSWFNHAVLIRLSDYPDLPSALRRIWAKLWEHHDALRLRFARENDEWAQEIAPSSPGLDVEFIDLRHLDDPTHEIEQHSNRIQQTFDIANGPLVRLVDFHTAEGHVLLVVIHHLVIDAVSWRIILEDFGTALQRTMEQRAIELPPVTHSYLRWCVALQEHRRTPAFERTLAYWITADSASSPTLPLRSAGSNLYGDVQSTLFRLSARETQDLLATACFAYNTTVEDLLLAALACALRASSARILVESHGRDGLEGLDVSGTVGWFTSIYPIVLDAPDPNDLGRTIKLTKETLRRVPRQGIDYGLWKQNGKHAPATVRFNYLGNPGKAESFSFEVSTDRTGQAVNPMIPRPVALDISAIVLNGQLEGSFAFSPYQIDSAVIEVLADSYHANLAEVIGHCCAQRETEVTPSDLTYSDLTLDEFDRILS